MKLSIITPTHNPKYIKELESSILAQTYQDWEWVILLNNGASYQATDPRIKIIEMPFKSDKIGEIKNYAFNQGTGEVLVEVDHDDLITPDCLEELANAFKANPACGFAYSDNAKLGKFIPYNKIYGWTHRTVQYNGQDLYAMHSQPLTPGRLGFIWYAPDHVRAWRTEVYKELGGHNKDLSVCDDQDLMCRTYLKTKFHFIPKVLYIYRILDDKSNTWLKRNKEIQQKTVELYDDYIYSLSARFADLNNLKKIDLCGGHNKPEGYESIDKFNGDIIADLEKGIPLPDNSVGVIRAHDALEHIKNSIGLMQEIHRVLAPGGMLLSLTPSTDGRGAFQDPTHVSFWNQNSFWYYTRAEQSKYINLNPLFTERRLKTYYPNEYCRINDIKYVKADLEAMK